MKKILLIALIAFGMNAKAQIQLEHTYDSAATWNFCSGNVSQLMMINFEVSGERYVRINRCGRVMSIYDLNHNLVRNISLAGLPLNYFNTVGDIIYISENLFDSDSEIEFMYVIDSASFYNTKIYNEDGSLIFSEFGAPFIKMNIHLQQYPIYNTSAGTKMILSYENGQAKVFGLAGSLTTGIEAGNEQLLNSYSISNPYPNPASRSTGIDYNLPEGVSDGEIVFYDVQGNEVKRFKVDKTSSHLLVSTSTLSAGTYYYRLETAIQNTAGKKMVVIK